MKTKILFNIVAQIFFRIVAIVASSISSWLLITDNQVIDVGGFLLDARFIYSPEFRFLAYLNIAVAGISLLSLLFVVLVGRRGSNPNHYFFLFLVDLVQLCMLSGGCAAATAVGFLGKYGNRHTGWGQICDQFGKFCDRATTAITISYMSLACLVVLTVTSVSKSRQIQV